MNQASLPKEAIGRYVTEAVPTAAPENRVRTIHQDIFEGVRLYDTINYVYVLKKKQQLVGVVSIKELADAKESRQIKDIMRRDLVTVRANTHRERAVYKALEHSLKALPIVDKQGKFLGVVPSDALLAILHQETYETLSQVAGVFPGKGEAIDDTLKLSIGKAFKRRVVWIIVGLFGGMLAARIVDGFEEILQANIILAGFIPLVVYLADAVGTQTQTLLVRDIAINPRLPMVKYTAKQLLTTALIGLVTGLIAWAVVVVGWQAVRLGVAVGAAVSTAILSSTLIAVLIPFLLSKLKQDPATGSGPFATILQDIASIVIYFLTASALLG